jgi:Tfp pilus assembly protein PilF
LSLDEYNVIFNSTINLNIALGYLKLKRPEEALSHLKKAVALNPGYLKAIVKRGEVHQ